MKIVVDSREKNSMVIANLIEQKQEIEIKTLEIGDYIIGDIAIERKTIQDFISSTINKRLSAQLENLKKYKRKILILEGFDYNREISGMHPNAIRGMFLSIELDYDTPIIFVKDDEETAKYLILLAKRFEKTKVYSLNPKRTSRNLKQQQQFVLEGFPGIGPVIAKSLLKEFKTLKNIINADLDKLTGSKKITESVAKEMKRILDSQYSKLD
ncbi:MAG: ERCC4 domain-containing protein [archaeon]